MTCLLKGILTAVCTHEYYNLHDTLQQLTSLSWAADPPTKGGAAIVPQSKCYLTACVQHDDVEDIDYGVPSRLHSCRDSAHLLEEVGCEETDTLFELRGKGAWHGLRAKLARFLEEVPIDGYLVDDLRGEKLAMLRPIYRQSISS